MFHRGDIWIANLDPTQGHEQRGSRPCLILSVDKFNLGPSKLVTIAPVTSKNKNIAMHVEIIPPEGGVRNPSYILCDQIRTISSDRLTDRWGGIKDDTMFEVEKRVKQLLGF